MPDTTVAIDGSKALEIALQFPAKVTFNHQAGRSHGVSDFGKLVIGQLTGPDVGINTGLLQNPFRGGGTNAINIGK